jgi:hypothetical protein
MLDDPLFSRRADELIGPNTSTPIGRSAPFRVHDAFARKAMPGTRARRRLADVGGRCSEILRSAGTPSISSGARAAHRIDRGRAVAVIAARIDWTRVRDCVERDGQPPHDSGTIAGRAGVTSCQAGGVDASQIVAIVADRWAIDPRATLAGSAACGQVRLIWTVRDQPAVTADGIRIAQRTESPMTSSLLEVTPGNGLYRSGALRTGQRGRRDAQVEVYGALLRASSSPSRSARSTPTRSGRQTKAADRPTAIASASGACAPRSSRRALSDADPRAAAGESSRPAAHPVAVRHVRQIQGSWSVIDRRRPRHCEPVPCADDRSTAVR